MDWYKHNAAKFLSGTSHMTFAERGAYITLLDYQWERDGYLPADELAIFRMVGAVTEDDQAVVRSVLEDKFPVTDDGRANQRMLDTITDAQEIRAKRRRAGQAGGQASAQARALSSGEAKGGSTRARARRASLLSTSSVSKEGESEGETEGHGLRWRVLRAFEEKFSRAVSPGGSRYLDERIEEGATYEQLVDCMDKVGESGKAIGTPNDVFNAQTWNAVRGNTNKPKPKPIKAWETPMEKARRIRRQREQESSQ